MREAIVSAVFELWADCPHCNRNIDILHHPYNDEDGVLLSPLTNNRWDDMKDIEVECSECKKVFKIKEVVY